MVTKVGKMVTKVGKMITKGVKMVTGRKNDQKGRYLVPQSRFGDFYNFKLYVPKTGLRF